MKLTCAQMDVLISFYLEGDLSSALKKQVEEHIESCAVCKAKYNIVDSMVNDMKESIKTANSNKYLNQKEFTNNKQYLAFKTNMSAYIDNELPSNESLKIKKFAINNNYAKKELETSYKIKKLINDSYNKTKNDAKSDFTRSTLKRLQIEEENALNFNPAIKLLVIFTVSVLVLTTIVLLYLSL